MKLKKAVSGLVATVVAMSCFVTSVGAEGGDIAKIKREFSLNYLNSLPKEGEAGFSQFLDLVSESDLDSDRLDEVPHLDGQTTEVLINEKKVYADIQNKVKSIVTSVKDGSFEEGIANENQKQEYNKMSEKMKIAGAIYEWVSKKIKYDYDSVKKDENGETPYRKLQDVFFVYNQQTGVCVGKAQLVTLMMRLAGIASVCVNTGRRTYDAGHTYNAVYLKQEDNADRTGWVLLDSSESAEDLPKYFPAFYNSKLNFQTNNEKALENNELWLLTGIDSEKRYYFTIDGVSYAPKYGDNVDDSYFEVFNSDGKKVNIKEIPPFISKLGMSLRISDGIESINVKDNKEAASLDVSVARDLKSINKDGSNKYVFLTGTIFGNTRAVMILDKETKEVISSSSKWAGIPIVGGTEQGVRYGIYLNNGGTKVDHIELGDFRAYGAPEARDVKIPEYLVQLNAPIQIKSNIKSLIVDREEIWGLLDISEARNLDITDVKNSKINEVRNGRVVRTVDKI